MLRRIYWELCHPYTPNYQFHKRFDKETYKVGDMVRIIYSHYNYDTIGIITRLPDKHSPYYDISTEEWPYGEWIYKGDFYILPDQDGREDFISMLKAKSARFKFKPKWIDPRRLSADMDLIYCNPKDIDDDVPTIIIYVMPFDSFIMPTCHIIFRGKDYGRDYRVRLDKAEYWAEKDLPELTESEKILIDLIFNKHERPILGYDTGRTYWQATVDVAWDEATIRKNRLLEKVIYKLKPNTKPDYTKLRRRHFNV